MKIEKTDICVWQQIHGKFISVEKIKEVVLNLIEKQGFECYSEDTYPSFEGDCAKTYEVVEIADIKRAFAEALK